MKTAVTILALLLLFSVFALPTDAAVDPKGEHIGVVMAAQGKCTATGADKNARDLSVQSKIMQNDKITTGAGAKIQIMFSDDSMISQGENSEMVIDEYVYTPKEPKKLKSSFKLVKGVFRTISGKITEINPDRFKVKTRMATIGIRGCEIGCRLRDDGLDLLVLDLPEEHEIVITDISKEMRGVGANMMAANARIRIPKEGIIVRLRKGFDPIKRNISDMESNMIIKDSTPDNAVAPPERDDDEDESGDKEGGPREDSGDGDDDKGHGNDADGFDEDNPGKNKDDDDSVDGDDNKGHGNDADGFDEDNPGKKEDDSTDDDMAGDDTPLPPEDDAAGDDTPPPPEDDAAGDDPLPPPPMDDDTAGDDPLPPPPEDDMAGADPLPPPPTDDGTAGDDPLAPLSGDEFGDDGSFFNDDMAGLDDPAGDLVGDDGYIRPEPPPPPPLEESEQGDIFNDETGELNPDEPPPPPPDSDGGGDAGGDEPLPPPPPQPDPEPAPDPEPDPEPDPIPEEPLVPVPDEPVRVLAEGGGTDWQWGIWTEDDVVDYLYFEPKDESLKIVNTTDEQKFTDLVTQSQLYSLQGSGFAAAIIDNIDYRELVQGTCDIIVQVGDNTTPWWDGTFSMGTGDTSLDFAISGSIQSDGKMTGSPYSYNMYLHGAHYPIGDIISSDVEGYLVGPSGGAKPTGAFGRYMFGHGDGTTVEGGFGTDLNDVAF